MPDELKYTDKQMQVKIKAEKAATRNSTIIALLVVFILLGCVFPVLCSISCGVLTTIAGV